MGNVRSANSIYVDAAGDAVIDQNVKLVYIVFTANGAGDELILRDGSSSGALKMAIKNDVADSTNMYEFDVVPVVFTNGIYVDTISSGATATLVTTAKGGI